MRGEKDQIFRTLDLPPREKAFGGQIGENYVICGGKVYNQTTYDDCFSISNTSGKLNKSYSKMKIPRHGAASVVLNNTLYISGGGISNIRSNKSAEIIQHYKSGFVEDLKQPLGCEIFGGFLLSFPQNERKIY